MPPIPSLSSHIAPLQPRGQAKRRANKADDRYQGHLPVTGWGRSSGKGWHVEKQGKLRNGLRETPAQGARRMAARRGRSNSDTEKEDRSHLKKGPLPGELISGQDKWAVLSPYHPAWTWGVLVWSFRSFSRWPVPISSGIPGPRIHPGCQTAEKVCKE